MLDVRKLLLLREVEARGSISAAARSLSYTRSAVSQQLTALEREVGVSLVERSHARAVLTSAGHTLVASTERVLAELEQAESELAATVGTVSGELRIGLSFHHGPPLLAQAVVRIHERYPKLRITLRGVSAEEGRRAARLGELDVVLAYRYDAVPEPRLPGLIELPLMADEVRLAVAVRHPLATGEPRHLSAFADERWVMNPASALGRLTLHACHEAGFEPCVAAEVDDIQATLGLVSPGWAVTLLPDLVPDRPESPVLRLSLLGSPRYRRIAIVMRRGIASAPAVQELLDELAVDGPPDGLD